MTIARPTDGSRLLEQLEPGICSPGTFCAIRVGDSKFALYGSMKHPPSSRRIHANQRYPERQPVEFAEHEGTPMFERTLFTALARCTNQPEVVRPPAVVPLPIIDGRPPVLLVFDQQDLAVELAYERYPAPAGTRVRSVTRDTRLYGISQLTPVFAVSGGVVVYARKHADGHTIIIDHCNKWLSVYHRLEHRFVVPSDCVPGREIRVAAGDALGYLAPSSPGPLKPLRFELWKSDPQQDVQQMDPLRYIRRWRYIDWSDPLASTK